MQNRTVFLSILSFQIRCWFQIRKYVKIYNKKVIFKLESRSMLRIHCLSWTSAVQILAAWVNSLQKKCLFYSLFKDAFFSKLRHTASNEGMVSEIMNGKDGVRKIHKKLSHDSRCPGLEMNPGPLEYETGVLTFRPRCSVEKCREIARNTLKKKRNQTCALHAASYMRSFYLMMWLVNASRIYQ